MAETLVKEEICNACQADVRPDSLFCYNCGASVTEEVVEEAIEKPDEFLSGSKIIEEAETGVEDFDEEIPEPDIALEEKEIREESKENELNELTDSSSSEKMIFEKDSSDIIEESANNVKKSAEVEQSKSGAAKNANLRSAASLRKRGNIKTKEVKITWEEYENAPNALFIAIALLLTLFAVGIYFVAMYLK